MSDVTLKQVIDAIARHDLYRVADEAGVLMIATPAEIDAMVAEICLECEAEYTARALAFSTEYNKVYASEAGHA